MTPSLAVLAQDKSLQTRHPLADWLNALVTARESLPERTVDAKNFSILAMSAGSPAKFTVVTRLIYQYAKSQPSSEQLIENIFGRVNASPFPLNDWIDAIDVFHAWLMKNQRKIDFLPMINYLECCVAAPDAREAGQTLAVLVVDMLSVFDYEAG